MTAPLTPSLPMPTPARPRIVLSWDEVQRDAALLASGLARLGTWNGIVAVTRGGLAPAAFVARALGIRTVETISVAAYQGEALGAPSLLKHPHAAGDGAGWLVIDDLVDTGTTMRVVRGLLPRAHVAVLYAKPAGRDLADTIVRAFPQESWIDFPWEMPLPAP
jgi:xanthine phosphoribosyltransferase